MNHAVTKYGLTRTGGLRKDITKLRAHSTCHPHNQVSRRDWDFFLFFFHFSSQSIFWQTYGCCSLCVRAWWIMKSFVYDTGLFWIVFDRVGFRRNYISFVLCNFTTLQLFHLRKGLIWFKAMKVFEYIPHLFFLCMTNRAKVMLKV